MKHVTFEENFKTFMNSLTEPELTYVKASRYRFREVINSIPRSPDTMRILDIGTSAFTLFIKETFPHCEVSTLDLTSRRQGRCESNGIEFKTCDLDEGYIPFEDDCFDVVVFTEVLEHVCAPPTDILNEIRRVMRTGGKLILSVPNIAALYQRIRLLFGISPFPHPDIQLLKGGGRARGHLREYTMKETTSLLEACGLAITSKKYVLGGHNIYGREPKGTLRSLRWMYDAVVLLIPPFRSSIHIECYKEVRNE